MKSTHHLNVSQRVGVVEQAVNVTSTEELIKQMANRSILSAEALQRSIAKFWPSTNPLSLKPLRNAASTLCESSGERLLMNPITGRVLCCARATCGHATTAPPTKAKNSLV
jgi:hypothetical protein